MAADLTTKPHRLRWLPSGVRAVCTVCGARVRIAHKPGTPKRLVWRKHRLPWMNAPRVPSASAR